MASDDQAALQERPHLPVTGESRDFLVKQMREIKKTSTVRLIEYFIALLATVAVLIWMIDVKLGIQDSGRVFETSLEDSFLEQHSSLDRDERLATESQDILSPALEERITMIMRKLERDMPKNELAREIVYTHQSVESGPPALYIKFHLGVRDGYTIQRLSGNFCKFYPSSVPFPGIPPLEFIEGLMPEFDKEIRRLNSLKHSDPIQQQHLKSQEVFPVLVQAHLTDQLAADINKARKQMSQDLGEKLKQNKVALSEIKERKKTIRKDHDGRIQRALEAPIAPEQYARMLARASVSIILVTFAFTIIILIRNEVTLYSKLQSVIVLAGGISFSVKDTSLFDAVERLHGYKGQAPDTKSIVDIVTAVLKKT